ncbi:MAG TPA: BTAD domain-containing putative transcriptional regulator, partial [Ktedonobacteraceae bacterium]|nr:BTAD domain-containing putative transcriptional regulator [Ktedonobacteraceae bacterium]
MIPTLHIHLLGEFLLAADEEPVTTFEMPRLQSLIAYLLLHRGVPQSRAHLAFLLWPDSTEQQAHTNLRKLLYLLRQGFSHADSFIRIGRQSITWEPVNKEVTWTLDVQDFEWYIEQAEQAERTRNLAAMRQALSQVVDLYRGDLLPSCYDEWILSERDRLRQAFFKALENLIGLLEEERNEEAAISYALRLIRYDPLHEETYRHLMRLYAVQGDRTSALRIYHACATVLERELGTVPGEATREMYQRLMQTDTSPTSRVVPNTYRNAAPFVGREREWAQLLSEWRMSMEGSRRLVLVSGEAGIGKSRLAEELISWVSRQGMVTAISRCYEASGALAYAPVTAWLQAEGVQDRLIPLPAIWLTEVVRLLPELQVRRPDLPAPGPITQRWQQQHFYEALARALLSARQPILFLLEDLQWCDTETLTWLHYLLHFDPQSHFLLLGTVRQEELMVDQPLNTLLLGLRREGLEIEIPLGALDLNEIKSLTESLVGQKLDSRLVDRLFQETEGNPLFLVEMIRAAKWGQKKYGENVRQELQSLTFRELPPTAQVVIETRLAQLSSPARELAGVAAVIGRAFPLKVLMQASGRDEDSLVQDVDELWQRRIIREQGRDAYDFSHDKLREGAYNSLSTARRRLLHRRVAEALELVYAATLDSVSGQIAVHYEQAGNSQQAILYYQRAGEAEAMRYAHADALAYFRHALSLLEATSPNPVESEQYRRLCSSLHESLGDILHVTGRQEEARQTYQRAVECYASQDRIRQARLYRKIAETMEEPGRHEEMLGTYRLAERILGQVSAEHGPEWWQEWVQVQLDQLVPLFYQDRVSEMTDIIERVQPFVEQYATAAQRAHFSTDVALRNLRRDRFLVTEETLSACQEALAVSIESGIPGEIGSARRWLGFAHLFRYDLEAAEEQLQAALHLGEQIGDVTLQVWCLAFLAIAARRRGQVETVQRFSERGLALVSTIQFPGILPHFPASLSWVAWSQGDLAQTQKQAQTALEMGQPLHLFPFQWESFLPLIAVALAEVRDADA